jgi:thiol-disulfide isomerase/thioredoxin
VVALVFYTKPGCPLCEEGREVVAYALSSNPVDVTTVDITRDEQLVERYGVLIPVVVNAGTGTELRWPFGPADVRKLLDEG